uniref:ANK_REP_REGION domain-containing protein n=1 Tax=Heterorhabditis bacteriophora TaxID=37862 RepID=A0A1I7XHL6_HETBA
MRNSVPNNEVLTTTDPTVKITRSQMKSLIGSREASRSNTPTPGVLLTDDDHCHGSPSPVFSQVEPKISARNTARRGRIRRVTKGTTRKDASGKRKRKADIFEKDKVLLDETMNSQTLSAIKSGRLASTDNINKLSITDPQDKVKLNNLDSCTKPDASLMVCDEEKNALITAPPLQLSRRRATHLLPCEISLNEKVSIKMLGEMLREMEVRHYGDEERYGCSQETFNADILSGQYMRVRRTVAHNVTSAPRLASWNDPYGANLLHLLCRSSKCDDKHTIDDIATMLCNLYPMVLKGRDSHGRIPLHDAVEKGQVCRVIRLLSFHSPVNVFDRRGNSPLIMAYGKNHAKMMRVLLMAGANFTALENSERKRPDSQRKKRAYDVLTKHARTVQSLMSRTRRKVYRCVTEYRSASPSFTAPFSDGPELTFQWQARCWGGLRLAKAPQLNGRSLTPTTSHQRNNHMMFHAVPCLGANVLTIRLGDTEV